MAGVLDKLLTAVGIYTANPDPYTTQGNGDYDEDEYYDDEGYADDAEQQDASTLNQQFRSQGGGRTGGGAPSGGSAAKPGVKGNTNNIVSLHPQKPNYTLVKAKPDRLEDAQLVCDHLKERHAVIVNVEGLDGREAQRIVDFIGGAVYALDCEIYDITNRIFTITPNYVDFVSIERDPKSRGFMSFGASGGGGR